MSARATFRLRTEGLKQVAVRVAHLVEAGALLAREEVVETMEPGPPRTGNIYTVPGTKERYQASAPGEPPAVREGIYVASLQSTPAVREGDFIRARVFTPRMVDGWLLGELLEYGTRRMLPRPHWRPAFQGVVPKLATLVRQAGA